MRMIPAGVRSPVEVDPCAFLPHRFALIVRDGYIHRVEQLWVGLSNRCREDLKAVVARQNRKLIAVLRVQEVVIQGYPICANEQAAATKQLSLAAYLDVEVLNGLATTYAQLHVVQDASPIPVV